MDRNLKLIAVVALVTCVFASSAFAQMRRGGRFHSRQRAPGPVYSGFGFGGATLFDLYQSGDIPVPPYFSLHPPVYYDRIVPQAYGSSPFAYPYTWWQQYGFPSVNLPGPYAHAPVMGPTVIENHHVPTVVPETTESPTEAKPAEEEARAVDRKVAQKAPVPLWIVNPYVTPNDVAPNDEHDSPQVRLAAGQ
jgi:hypothetical protein